jgi:hypothetical protein
MIEIISLLIALLAVIVSPFISYKIAKKNLEFQFRNMTQEKWIDKLEIAAVDFLDNCNKWIEKYRGLFERVSNGSLKIEDANNLIDEMFDKMNIAIIKISLYLDESKQEQNEIIESVVKIKQVILSKTFNENNIELCRENYDKILTNLKLIIKNERKSITKLFR